MAYDLLDRVISETSAGVTHASTWDKGGNRLTVTYGGTGRVLTSTYDNLGRLETLSEKLPSETTPRLTSYFYDANGNVTGKTHPNGTAESTSYDALNRRMVHQVTVGSTVLSSFTFSHDKLSNVVQIIESYHASAGIAGRTVTNTYDKTRRLLVETAAEPGKTVVTTYVYDKANNRTSKVVATTPTGGPTTTETHGYVYGHTSNGLNSNQLWKWIKPNPGEEVVYSYDANGNRSTRTETVNSVPTNTDTYTWDHWNRLTSLDLQSKDAAVNGTYAYGYDHRTRRVVRDESAIAGRTRDLVIFSGGTSVQEHEGETGATPANAAAPDMEYIRGSDWGGGVGGILYTSRAGMVSWAHYNGRGDVVTRTSGTGSLTYAATYEAFGTRTQEAGTNPDRQRANTKEEDPTGLLNEGHRYRDLELGMFISRGPAGFVDGPNVYTYVVQNPWSAFDPEGLEIRKGEGWEEGEWEKHDKKIRESSYYENSRYKEVSESKDFIVYVNKVPKDETGDTAKNRYNGLTDQKQEERRNAGDPRSDADGIVYINPSEDTRSRMGENDTKIAMSIEGVMVHEMAHAWDHMKNPVAYHDQAGELRNFFRQDEAHMQRFPNNLERFAVEEQNRYHDSVNEPKRVRYGTPDENLQYHGINPRSGIIDPTRADRGKPFEANRKAWMEQAKKSNNPSYPFDPARYRAGLWPKKPKQ
jgi:RHS repeat-associated protein